MLTSDKVLDSESSVAECQDVDNGNETNEINEAYEINNATRIDQTHLIRPIFGADLVFIFLVRTWAPNPPAPASPPWRGCARARFLLIRSEIRRRHVRQKGSKNVAPRVTTARFVGRRLQGDGRHLMMV